MLKTGKTDDLYYNYKVLSTISTDDKKLLIFNHFANRWEKELERIRKNDVDVVTAVNGMLLDLTYRVRSTNTRSSYNDPVLDGFEEIKRVADRDISQDIMFNLAYAVTQR